MKEYRMANACEQAFDKYEVDLLRAGRHDLDDMPTRWTISRMFFGATSLEELERYSAMTPEELVALAAAEKDREDELERQGEQNP